MVKKIKCSKCGSFNLKKIKNIVKNGFVYTTEGKKQRFLCKICGHIWREN